MMAAEAIDLDDIGGLGNDASAWVGELQSDAWDAGDVGRDLHGSLAHLSLALKGLDAAEAKATELLTDPRYDRAWAQGQAQQLVTTAYEQARQAQADLRTSSSTRQSGWHPRSYPSRPTSLRRTSTTW